MEMVLVSGFSELSVDEMEFIDGGSKQAAQAVLIVGGAVLVGVGAPAVGMFAGTAAFATAYITGVGLMGSAFFI